MHLLTQQEHIHDFIYDVLASRALHIANSGDMTVVLLHQHWNLDELQHVLDRVQAENINWLSTSTAQCTYACTQGKLPAALESSG